MQGVTFGPGCMLILHKALATRPVSAAMPNAKTKSRHAELVSASHQASDLSRGILKQVQDDMDLVLTFFL
jgi:hypothetical protein